MQSFSRPQALLDANVLYPAPLRDMLLNLAVKELYTPKWSQQIQNEWSKKLLTNRLDLNWEQVDHTITKMNTAFPGAIVEEFEQIIRRLVLPDPGDRHVLAAAIKCGAEVIITSNLKDFPEVYLDQFDVEAQHPDTFINNIIAFDQATSLTALQDQVKRLRNPPLTIEDVLLTLERNGLKNSVAYFRALLSELKG